MKLPWKDKTPGKADLKASLGARSFRVGGYSVVATALVIVIAVVANLFVNALPATITQLDATDNAMFTISQETKEILSGLEDEVTVYWIVQSGQEDDTLGTLLERYAAMSSKLTVDKRDPDVYPALLEKYVTASTIYNNSLIVLCGDRSTYVSYEDIYEYTYDSYYSYSISFAGESCLTSAIHYVVSDSLPKVYLLTGHGESSLSSSYQTAVEKQNIELEEISLITEDAVPDDADCLIINGPTSDISEHDKELILAYLESGGDLIVLTDPLSDGTERPNLEALMAEYGMTIAEGIVIEGSSSNYALGSPAYLLPNISSHTITSPLAEGGYYILLALAQGIEVEDDLRDGLSVSALLTTSSQAYSKIAGYSMETYSKEDGDISGPFYLAAAATDSTSESHVIWITSTTLVQDAYNQQVSGANQDLFLNCISWVCDQEEGISIHAKSISTEYLTISSYTASLLTVLVVGVIPLVYLGVGIRIWIRRRKG